LKSEPCYRQNDVLPSRGKFCRAFTLIELLIVVAIIAILAAIATPNFMEAQTRAKVSRVKSDLRTIATGLDTYILDYNIYPYASGFFTPMPSLRLVPITTPVAYLNAIPNDPFMRTSGNNYEDAIRARAASEPLNVYLYNIAVTRDGGTVADSSVNKMSYALTSGGPDRAIQFAYYPFDEKFLGENGTYINYPYDATNGTLSRGDIFRRGGAATVPLPGID